MNWFEKIWNNANFHIFGAMAAGAASIAFPQFAVPLQVVAGTLGTAAAALPGGSVISGTPPGPVPVATPVTPAPVVVLPAAAAGGSYHAVDYANLAAALLAQFAPKPVEAGSRG